MNKSAKAFLASVARCGLGVAVALPVFYFLLTGSPIPIIHVESLQHPVRVLSWNQGGLLLRDGRTLRLPGVHSLPSTSAALTELTKRGVEIAPDGHIYCLVDVHHWCGNDPVRKDLRKVDLSAALQFLHVGETDTPLRLAEQTARAPGGSFSEWGWNVSEAWRFLSWQRASAVANEPEP